MFNHFRSKFSGSQRAKKANRRIHRSKVEVEVLEDRSVPASFTPGDLAVFLANSSTASNTSFNIVEINPNTPASNPVQSIAIPSPLRASGSASSTGYLSLSNDGSYLAFDVANTTNTTTNTNTILSRSVGTLDLGGNFGIAANYTGANGNQPRGATSIDNSNWFIGDQGGVYTNNATTPTPAGNFRATKAFGGTVYTLTASGTATNVVVSTVSLAGAGSVTGLPGLTNDAAAADFTLVSSGANGSAFDVLYVTDDTSATVGAIKKYALIGGTWTAEGTAVTTGMFGIAAATDPVAGFDLYVTTGNGSSGSNNVDKFVDSAAWNAPISLNLPTVLFTTATATNLKGIAFVPSVSATTTTVSSSTGGTAVYGTGINFTATVTSDGTPVTSGNVQFMVDGNPAGAPVAVSASGQATSAAISNLQVTGSPHVVTANYLGSAGSFGTSIGTLAGGQSVTPLTLSVTGIIATDKVYDGTTAGTAQLHLGLASVSGIPGDDVSLVTSGAVGTFDAADVNTATKIVVSGLTLAGAQQADYQLPTMQATVPAEITQADLNVTGVTANDKPYDGNTTATLDTSGAALSGLATGDTGVTLDSSGAGGMFISKNVASGILVEMDGFALNGTTQDGMPANIDYNLIQGTSAADITQVGSTTTVTWTDGTSVTFDGNPHGATASWASTGTDGAGGPRPVTYVGISGTTYGPTLTAPSAVGQYQASASFAGDTNHTGSSNSANFAINSASAPTLIVITSVALLPSTNLATDNDFTRFANAFDSIAAGGTVEINGTLDWSEPNALASWQATGEAFAMPHLDGITVSAVTRGSGVKSPGDDPTVQGEGPFYFDGLGTDKSWNITGLQISNFDTAIFYSPEGDVTDYSGTHLINNSIGVPNANPGAENGGIILGPSPNQVVQGNSINITGLGGATASSFGISAFSFDGAGAWNNLLIDSNTINVSTLTPNEDIIGISENTGSTGSNITVSNNTFRGNSGTKEVAFGITSDSTSTATVVYTGNRVFGAHDGFVWGDPEATPPYDFSNHVGITFSNTTLTNVDTGFVARDGAKVTVGSTTIENTGLFNFGTAFSADGAGTVITVTDPVSNFFDPSGVNNQVENLKSETNGGIVVFLAESGGISNVSKPEGNSGVTLFSFTVTLDAAPAANQMFTVQYGTADGTANAGSDYESAFGILTFLPGQQSAAISVKVGGDLTPEPDETFFVNLSNPLLYTDGSPAPGHLSTTQVVGTILNDDTTTLAASIQNATGTKSATLGATSTMTFASTLNGAVPAGEFFTVNYHATDGTAHSNVDFSAPDGTLTFLAGSTTPVSPITVTLAGSPTMNPPETFSVTLSTPLLHFIGLPQTLPGNIGTGTATGTIVSPPASGAVVSINNVSKLEGSTGGVTPFTFTISYTGTLTSNIQVNYKTQDGTALAGQDYATVNSSVVLTPTVTSQTITVMVGADHTVEPDENFFVVLSNPGGNYTFGTSTGMGTILNDD